MTFRRRLRKLVAPIPFIREPETSIPEAVTSFRHGTTSLNLQSATETCEVKNSPQARSFELSADSEPVQIWLRDAGEAYKRTMSRVP